MNEQIEMMAKRLAGLREILEISQQEMAEVTGVSLEEYQQLEAGKKDFSFSFLFKAANRFGVDVTELVTGDRAKLSHMTLVRRGHGMAFERRKEYVYHHLAYTFKNRKCEPFMVTVHPDKTHVTENTHEGQELNYVVCGRIQFWYDGRAYVLEAGDSVYFDSGRPHAMYALDNQDAQFVAVVLK
ncbi:MAG: helix-turn-helix domain-containing protein [Christensenellales bacterium]|jgi:transcriptional regulator with XRE-family HTH domain